MGRPDASHPEGNAGRLIALDRRGSSCAPSRLRLSLPATLASVRTLGTALRIFARRRYGEGVHDRELHDLRLATQEACSNIIRHGVHHDAAARMRCRIEGRDRGLAVTIQDQGPPFDPSNPLACPPAPEDLAEGGYGLFLINTLVDEIRYETSRGWNSLTLVKYWKESRNHDDGPHLGHR